MRNDQERAIDSGKADMTTTPQALPELPPPWDHCYEWDGPYGKRKFTAAKHNGVDCSRSLAVYTADQMHAYARAAIAAQQPADAVPSETGWLIEQCIGGCHHWWSGEFKRGEQYRQATLHAVMTNDAGLATRFATRDSAQKVLDSLLALRPFAMFASAPETYMVTEHMWPVPAATQPAAPEPACQFGDCALTSTCSGECWPPTATPEPETVPWPVVTSYSGGASHEGIGGRVSIRLADDGPEVEYVPAAAPAEAQAMPVAQAASEQDEAVAYPRDFFSRLIHEGSPYAFYIFQWVPYQTDAKRWRLKLQHDVRTFDGREALNIWPNGSHCGPFRDDEVEFIRISRSQFGAEWKDPRPDRAALSAPGAPPVQAAD